VLKLGLEFRVKIRVLKLGFRVLKSGLGFRVKIRVKG
jgi:hypothetical protein